MSVSFHFLNIILWSFIYPTYLKAIITVIVSSFSYSNVTLFYPYPNIRFRSSFIHSFWFIIIFYPWTSARWMINVQIKQTTTRLYSWEICIANVPHCVVFTRRVGRACSVIGGAISGISKTGEEAGGGFLRPCRRSLSMTDYRKCSIFHEKSVTLQQEHEQDARGSLRGEPRHSSVISKDNNDMEI